MMASKEIREKRLKWVWGAVMQRCYNPNNKSYHNYGGRGIRVCDMWRNFSSFFSDMGLPEKGMTLERVDNNGDYSHDNCIWADRFTQAQNRRYARIITVDGLDACIKEHWRRVSPEGLTYRRVMKRIGEQGWEYNDALKKPVRGCAND